MYQISLVHNTLWNWGEYLRIVNVLDDHDQVSLVNSPADIVRDPTSWVPSLVAGVTGTPQPAYMFFGSGTVLRKPPGEIFQGITIPITTTSETEAQRLAWGWEMSVGQGKSKLHLGQPPAPSGMPLLLGQNGDLVQGTPFTPQYTVTKPKAVRGHRRIINKTTWFNTWATGLNLRLSGYDMHYTVGSDFAYRHIRVMYAANNVQLTPPPLIDLEGEESTGYRWAGVTDRDRIFAENVLDCLRPGESKTFSWRLGDITMMATPDMKALEASTIADIPYRVTRAVEVFKTDLTYIATVMAKYNRETADFQISTVAIGQLPPQPMDSGAPLVPSTDEQNILAAVLED
jgi:hypothetical protein